MRAFEKADQQRKLALIHNIKTGRSQFGDDPAFAEILDIELRRLRAELKELCQDHLEERVAIAERIALVQESHQLPVYVWGRDCDMVEADGVTIIPATVMSYIKFEDERYRYAEGPTTVQMINHAEYARFQPTYRDRIGEAWDNGNTTAFYV